MNERGQLLMEFNLVMLLLVFPLAVGGTVWFWSELNRSKCAFETFVRARNQLIASNSPTTVSSSCGEIQESIHLLPLELLDQNKGGISASDLQSGVSQLSVDALRSYQQLQGLVSAVSASASTK